MTSTDTVQDTQSGSGDTTIDFDELPFGYMNDTEKLTLQCVQDHLIVTNDKEGLASYYDEMFKLLASYSDFESEDVIELKPGCAALYLYFKKCADTSEQRVTNLYNYLRVADGFFTFNQRFWKAFYDFMYKIKDDYSDYRTSDDWPVTLDAFVAEQKKRSRATDPDLVEMANFSNKKSRGLDSFDYTDRMEDDDDDLTTSRTGLGYSSLTWNTGSSGSLLSSFKKSKSGYVGLANQGATCYMNSLLQTLYMTPEFRHAIYQWQYDETRDGPAHECIAFQLQKLFARLQTSDSQSVGTTELTKSFGWDENEGFKQHDVQELCRVLFDALEKTFKGSESQNVINELYQGEVVDYVFCKGCNKENRRNDKFLDVSLVVRETSSMHDAMANFLKPELLEGDNAYRCGSCGNKCNAAKGLKFNSLPYLLTIQLKRFDFDFETLDRIKLNNRFSFPFYVDMNDFVDTVPPRPPTENADQKTEENADQKTEENAGQKAEDIVVQAAESTGTADIPPPESPPPPPPSQPDDNSAVLDATNFSDTQWDDFESAPPAPTSSLAWGTEDEENVQDLLFDPYAVKKSKPSTGGSSATRLGSTARTTWDPTIRSLGLDDDYDLESGSLTRTSGSSSGYTRLSTINEPREREKKEVKVETAQDVPAPTEERPYIYELYSVLVHSGSALGGHYYAYIKSFTDNKWYKFNDSYVSESSEQEVVEDGFGGEEESSRSTFTRRLYSSSTNAYMLMYRQVHARNIAPPSNEEISEKIKTALAEAETIQAHSNDPNFINLFVTYQKEKKTAIVSKGATFAQFQREAAALFELTIEEKNYRLRAYNSMLHSAGETYEGREEKTIKELHFWEDKSFLLETKQDHERFSVFKASDIILKVHVMNRETKEYLPVQEVVVDRDAVLGEVKIAIEQQCGLPLATMQVYRSGHSKNMELLEGDDQSLWALSVFAGDSLYAEDLPEENAPSVVMEVYNRDKNMITIRYNIPGTNEYDQNLRIDSTQPMSLLKTLLAQALNLNEMEFKLCRGSEWVSTYEPTEYRDMEETIKSVPLIEGSRVLVKMGAPLLMGQFKTAFYHYRPEVIGESPLKHLFDLGVEEHLELSQLRFTLSAKLAAEHNMNIAPENLRIRDIISDRGTKVLDPALTYRQNVSYPYDGKKLCLQEIKPEEVPAGPVILVVVSVFDTNTYSITRRFEIAIPKSGTYQRIGELMAEQSGIALENVCVAKPWQYSAINPLEVSTLAFYRPASPDISKKSSTGSPWFLQDGDLLLLRDWSIPFRELTTDEEIEIEKKHAKPQVSYASSISTSTSSFTSTTTWKRPKEEGISIKTKYDRDAEKENKEKAAADSATEPEQEEEKKTNLLGLEVVGTTISLDRVDHGHPVTPTQPDEVSEYVILADDSNLD